jgi:hypothetical protein
MLTVQQKDDEIVFCNSINIIACTQRAKLAPSTPGKTAPPKINYFIVVKPDLQGSKTNSCSPSPCRLTALSLVESKELVTQFLSWLFISRMMSFPVSILIQDMSQAQRRKSKKHWIGRWATSTLGDPQHLLKEYYTRMTQGISTHARTPCLLLSMHDVKNL